VVFLHFVLNEENVMSHHHLPGLGHLLEDPANDPGHRAATSHLPHLSDQQHQYDPLGWTHLSEDEADTHS